MVGFEDLHNTTNIHIYINLIMMNRNGKRRERHGQLQLNLKVDNLHIIRSSTQRIIRSSREWFEPPLVNDWIVTNGAIDRGLNSFHRANILHGQSQEHHQDPGQMRLVTQTHSLFNDFLNCTLSCFANVSIAALINIAFTLAQLFQLKWYEWRVKASRRAAIHVITLQKSEAAHQPFQSNNRSLR
ncbi:ribosomal RNA small subunit methyltransferase G [Striga asiatica]|uniref:Ribosomal RNA small subunit methyltransferase G n=1 Tax=Striga asiatica TaxID=4170 RepID=A0A5A7R0J8_STRAF|nr:ribosomal RNA small subunit methyltransferase G [Striga asiatica]